MQEKGEAGNKSERELGQVRGEEIRMGRGGL